jgi:nucleotide-binding universal stress UspA family protein
MKKICIALDYNPSAKKVAETGHAYAKALGAKTALVHVISDAVYYAMDYAPFMGYESPFNSTNFEVVEELRKGAENFLSATAEHLGGKDITTTVLDGDTADAILDYAVENNIDLLVLGTHSHSALENVLMGNTAVKVVRHAKIPLLIVPTRN